MSLIFCFFLIIKKIFSVYAIDGDNNKGLVLKCKTFVIPNIMLFPTIYLHIPIYISLKKKINNKTINID